MTTSYTYDGNSILREVRGTTTLRYVQGRRVDEPLAVDDSSALTYYHADGLGSVVKTTNAAGTVTLTRQYDAWGSLESGATEPGVAFTGREWDPETGLYYYRARYYDSRVGVFVSEDPARSPGNLYSYVYDRPTVLVDPSGLWAAGAGAAASGALPSFPGKPTAIGEASCSVVVDGSGNVGLLCCAGAGMGVSIGAGVASAGLVVPICLSCKTICDMPGFYAAAFAGGTAGAAGGTFGYGWSVTSTTSTHLPTLQWSWGEGAAGGPTAGSCWLQAGGAKCKTPCP